MPRVELGCRWVIGLPYVRSNFGILAVGEEVTKQQRPRPKANSDQQLEPHSWTYLDRVAPPSSYRGSEGRWLKAIKREQERMKEQKR